LTDLPHSNHDSNVDTVVNPQPGNSSVDPNELAMERKMVVKFPVPHARNDIRCNPNLARWYT
jgi:hypothetical protein